MEKSARNGPELVYTVMKLDYSKDSERTPSVQSRKVAQFWLT